MDAYWRKVLGPQVVESVLAGDQEPPAGGHVRDREHRDEREPASHVAAVAEEFANHFRVHGVLPPPEVAEQMFATAREHDEFAAERAVEERAATRHAHWRTALGGQLVEAMLSEAA
jgi:hypothetical protein